MKPDPKRIRFSLSLHNHLVMAHDSSETFVLSLGGSLISVDGKIDDSFLKKFISLITAQVRQGRKFIIVCGGGWTCREYNRALSSIAKPNNRELDFLGIEVTRLNANLVRLAFGNRAHSEIVVDPTAPLRTNKSIIIGAGWKPGRSTDYDAVLLAKKFHAGTIVNLTNTSFVYNRDPKKYSDARPLREISWKEYRKLVGSKWVPGSNLPFDPIASKLAHESGLRVIVTNGGRLDNLKKILDGGRFRGTVID
ncbi:TPA: UMP kinase [Candidatus Uhrbacteria bacterium]|nr:UMP kinase [Candidatus Uhrbacteria bacterium]